MLCFDIGANIGKWSEANISKFDKIIAVEASPITYAELYKNINNDNIIPLNYAICDNNNEDITFYHSDCDVISTLNKDWLANEKSRFNNKNKFKEIIVKTTTLDDLIQRYGVPELIKIDVEAAEYECIKSLTQKVNLLCFEWASELNDITFNCLNYLTKLGFTKFHIQYEDKYTYEPDRFSEVNDVINALKKTTPKKEWGMIWCK
jgi:FkbM family methyltransferase